MTSLIGYQGPTGSPSLGNNTGNFTQPRGERGAAPGEYVPKGYRKGTINNYGPEQLGRFRELFGLTDENSYLGRLARGDEGLFDEMEAPEFRQFSGIQGNLASKFSGMGGLGARKSSGFKNTINAAGSNFAQDLASRRQDLQRQALKDLYGISESLLNQRPQENLLTPKAEKKPSFLESFGTQFSGSFANKAGETASNLLFGKGE